MNLTHTEYHLDRLQDHGFVDAALSMGAPAQYYLTRAGRAYLIERNFI